MKLDICNISFSKVDRKNNINIPKTLTISLAEIIGILVADGYIRADILDSNRKSNKSDVYISCNREEEGHISHICRIFDILFGYKLKRYYDKRSKCVNLVAHSKAIVSFLTNSCQLPIGKKVDIVSVPEFIQKCTPRFQYAFLRGVADSDFSLTFKNRNNTVHNYPVLKGSFASQPLVKDIEIMLKSYGFTMSTCMSEKIWDIKRKKIYSRSSIYLYGKKNLSLWVNLMGFSNPKFLIKINKWRKDGYCPPGYVKSLRRDLP